MKVPILSLKNLNVRFSETDVVKDVSFDLFPGEILALVGESGSGKSVSAHSILRLLPKSAQIGGEILFEGRNLGSLPEEELREIRGKEISMVFQEPMTSLNPLHTIGRQIREVIGIHNSFSKSQVVERILELLDQVGFPEGKDRLEDYPHQLSGGQRQRVMIAMALACNPKILIADEPTTALDVTIQAQILDLFQKLRAQGVSILMITHDLGIVERIADRIVILEKGTVVESGDAPLVLEDPQHPYTQLLLRSGPKGQPIPIKKKTLPLLEVSNCSINFKLPQTLFQAFKREQPLFKAVDSLDFYLQTGETLGIVGESGSGKSTLALGLLRLIETEGDIRFQGNQISTFRGAALQKMRSELQIVFQDPFGSLSPRMTAGDIVGEGLEVHFPDLTQDAQKSLIVQAFKDVHLDPQSRHRFPHEFSGGQRQRIALARALILNPALIVLDEPTSALDRGIQGEIVDLLRELQLAKGISYIFISHDLKVVSALAHRVLVMKEGQILEQGPTQDVFSNPQHPYTHSLIKASYL